MYPNLELLEYKFKDKIFDAFGVDPRRHEIEAVMFQQIWPNTACGMDWRCADDWTRYICRNIPAVLINFYTCTKISFG